MMNRYAAIMAGGSGERFWPLSRRARPKQLLSLTGSERTMLGDTVQRVQGLIPADNILVLTAIHLADAITEWEPSIPVKNILCEPSKRNTAGCLCWLASNLLVHEQDPSKVSLAILAADHRIAPNEAFIESISSAMNLAEEGHALVTIGIRPTRPDIGYGYIESDLTRPIEVGEPAKAYHVTRFHEKPSSDLAAEYVATEGFYWNSGMFFWRLDLFLSELERVAPQHFAVTMELVPLLAEGNQAEAAALFATLHDISIDYLLMERASSVAVVEATFEWDDVGSWDAIARYVEQDVRGNASLGDNVMVNTADCMIHNTSKEITVCLSGVYDLMVVVTDDAVLICDKEQSQTVREVVAKLNERKSTKL